MIIFSDAATSPQAGIAIGAFICMTQSQLDDYLTYDTEGLLATLAHQVIYKQYASNKSTGSEIQTIIDALSSLESADRNLTLYTDCQSLCDLLGRRKEKLQKTNFITRTGKPHSHAELYQTLYKIAENFQIAVVKVKGHTSTNQRSTLHDKIFAVLDKLARKRLRAILP